MTPLGDLTPPEHRRCRWPGCDRWTWSHGLCMRDYQRVRRRHPLDHPIWTNASQFAQFAHAWEHGGPVVPSWTLGAASRPQGSPPSEVDRMAEENGPDVPAWAVSMAMDVAGLPADDVVPVVARFLSWFGAASRLTGMLDAVRMMEADVSSLPPAVVEDCRAVIRHAFTAIDDHGTLLPRDTPNPPTPTE